MNGRGNAHRKASMRSCYRYLPGSQDKGQRYVVSYRDGLGADRDYGFTDDLAQAQTWLRVVSKNEMWSGCCVRDRQPPLPL